MVKTRVTQKKKQTLCFNVKTTNLYSFKRGLDLGQTNTKLNKVTLISKVKDAANRKKWGECGFGDH